MKDKFLQELYKYDSIDDSYHVTIDLDSYRDVYSEWDYSPVINRDIDDDLIDYLMDCSQEIGLRRNMAIDFYIPDDIVNEEKERKSVIGFHHYFAYRIRKIKAERLRKLNKLYILLIIGVAFLSSANLIGMFITGFASSIISEGLFIGAWVAVWEIFNTIFFGIGELSRKLKHYNRLRMIPINYKVKS